MSYICIYQINLKQIIMNLFKGLPLKTITAEHKNREGTSFGVTTEVVNDLITIYLSDFNEENSENYNSNFYEKIEAFDNSFFYAVPQHVFNDTDESIINFINTHIKVGVRDRIIVNKNE